MLLVNSAGNAYCESDNERLIQYKISCGWIPVKAERKQGGQDGQAREQAREQDGRLDELTRAKLMEACRERGIKFQKNSTKAALIELLKGE